MAEEAGEDPVFPPSPAFSDKAHVKSLDEYKTMYARSIEHPQAFWGEIAAQFHWSKEWTALEKHNYDRSKGKVSIEWFMGGETNLCFNALDRHVENGRGSQVAFHWEGNDEGETKDVTYQELLDEVCRIANTLQGMGVKKGEPVAIYLPMVLELPAAMLACARMGAVHSVIFGGFSAESLASRILDAKCKVVITADGVMRGGKMVITQHTCMLAGHTCT